MVVAQRLVELLDSKGVDGGEVGEGALQAGRHGEVGKGGAGLDGEAPAPRQPSWAATLEVQTIRPQPPSSMGLIVSRIQ